MRKNQFIQQLLQQLIVVAAFLLAGSITGQQVRAQNIIQGTWATQANDFAANVGRQYTFYFPPGGTISSRVWGTDIYTYDCSIASAAVHAGLITPQNGGTVTIEIRAGQSSYKGTTRNGVTSRDWGAFGGSFVFVKGTPVIQNPPPAPASNIIQGTWATQANDYAANVGKQYTFYFPPGGTISSRVWGTDIYTYDCSIASAAVHAGLITPQNGGTVTIEIRAGQPAYKGTARNGVTSRDWGAFGGSFVFVKGTPVTQTQTQTQPPPASNIIQGTWATQANDYAANVGKQYTFYFPPGGTISSRVWGTDIYTYDCSIASAAVHAGLITPQNGGTVTIEIRAGQPSYKGTTRNGVTSRDWGAFGGSFVFVKGTPVTQTQPPPASNIIQGTWATQANDYAANVGRQYTFYFPPGGTISSRVWGTDIYTYDCSIASAAVHAGLITPQNGGTVTIEIRAGQPSYKGTTRNGVTSKDWGAFGGSFVFIK